MHKFFVCVNKNCLKIYSGTGFLGHGFGVNLCPKEDRIPMTDERRDQTAAGTAVGSSSAGSEAQKPEEVKRKAPEQIGSLCQPGRHGPRLAPDLLPWFEALWRYYAKRALSSRVR